MTAILDIQQINNGQLPSYGQVFVGNIGTDPISSPTTVYSDRELTLALITPLDLDFNGRPLDPDTGEVVTLYIGNDYSIQWQDKLGNSLLPEYIDVKVVPWSGFVDVDEDVTLSNVLQCVNVDASGGDVNVGLPTLAPGNYIVKKANVSGGNVIISGGVTIDGQATEEITTHNDTRTIVNGETEWKIA
jgi:hypothetical protein